MAADWLNMSTEVSAQKTLQAQVLDHSLAGYRLHWPEDQILRARVGEIIGINLAGIGNQPDWMVAVIRWLRYERDGSMTAGLKLLTRRCHAVALRVNKDGQPGQLLRGLELEALAADLPRRFLMSDRLQGRSHMLDVMFGFEPNRIGPVRTQQTLKTTPHSLASNMDYTLLNEQS